VVIRHTFGEDQVLGAMDTSIITLKELAKTGKGVICDSAKKQLPSKQGGVLNAGALVRMLHFEEVRPGQGLAPDGQQSEATVTSGATTPEENSSGSLSPTLLLAKRLGLRDKSPTRWKPPKGKKAGRTKTAAGKSIGGWSGKVRPEERFNAEDTEMLQELLHDPILGEALHRDLDKGMQTGLAAITTSALKMRSRLDRPPSARPPRPTKDPPTRPLTRLSLLLHTCARSTAASPRPPLLPELHPQAKHARALQKNVLRSARLSSTLRRRIPYLNPHQGAVAAAGMLKAQKSYGARVCMKAAATRGTRPASAKHTAGKTLPKAKGDLLDVDGSFGSLSSRFSKDGTSPSSANFDATRSSSGTAWDTSKLSRYTCEELVQIAMRLKEDLMKEWERVRDGKTGDLATTQLAHPSLVGTLTESLLGLNEEGVGGLKVQLRDLITSRDQQALAHDRGLRVQPAIE
ncbi:hypothetical protein CYMTET_25186, partial [Cymbomonas tetramitiformis]